MFPFVSLPTDLNPHKCLASCFGSEYEFGGRVSARANLGKCCGGWAENCAFEETACTVFSALREKAVYVVFQGTTSLQQLKHEFESFNFLVQLPMASGGGRVSLYYWNAFLRLWEGGLAVKLLRFTRRHPNFELRITGHSMGGALAALAASFIAHHKLIASGASFNRRIRLYTFGAVHCGDRRWALELKRAVPDSFRVINHWDIVPQIARSVRIDYYHYGTEVWYNNLMLKGHPFRQCHDGQSAFCSVVVHPLLWNWLDHLFYFGTFVFSSCQLCMTA
ncbi:hypothetical protein niasHT_001591 [Heterodera trifolii]|uniref:Fungal lipase-type domain-containing protein n=1 Tax=Heterodera trifolii TaxID=157864 RepID=A0ABD2MB55_9BILA